MSSLIFVLLSLLIQLTTANELTFGTIYKKPRIVGGSEAQPHSIPNQALLEIYSMSSGWYCGGSLISKDYILTAGHCCDEALWAYVILGAHKPLEPEATQLRLLTIIFIVHELYDKDATLNDIALVKLLKPIDFTPEIQPISLPSRLDINNSYIGAVAQVSGWGLTSFFDSTLSPVLNVVDIEVVSLEQCENDYGNLSDAIICTASKTATVCNGDSGGPLIVEGVQVGIVSFGIFFCVPGFTSGFTRISSFLDWIELKTDVEVS